MILLRNLQGVGPLEWALAQDGWTPQTESRASELSMFLFGIDREDTEPWIDENGAHIIGGDEAEVADADDLRRKAEAWEKNFEVLKLFRDESDAFWASVGWDVTDGDGRQLEAMRYLDRPLVCVVKKIHSCVELNLGAEEEADAWGASLAEEARLFKPR